MNIQEPLNIFRISTIVDPIKTNIIKPFIRT